MAVTKIANKYLDNAGLEYFAGKVKQYIDKKNITVASGDKILSITADDATNGRYISSTLSFNYVSADKKIYLRGKDNVEIGAVDCTDFLRDGMLKKVTLHTVAEEGVTVEVPYLKFVFNTSESVTPDPIRVSVKSLVDIYNGKNLLLSDSYADKTTDYNASNIKIGASMDVAIAELKKGIAEAMANAGVTSFGGATGAITLKAAGSNNGDVNLTMNGNELGASIEGLGTAAFTDADAYDEAGAADAAKAEVIGATGDASTADTIYGAKKYADEAVAGKNVTAEGETGNTALVSASAANNKVTVSSTQKLKDAVTRAEGAVLSVGKATSTENFVEITVTDGDNATIAISDAKLKTKTDEIDGKLAVIQGADTVAGSIAKAEKDAKAYADSLAPNYATAAQGDKADSAIQGVTGETAITQGSYIEVKVSASEDAKHEVTLSTTSKVTVQAVETAGAAAKGLAEASDVKTYVDSKVSGKNVSAEGDEWVAASAANNKVTITTNTHDVATAATGADGLATALDVKGEFDTLKASIEEHDETVAEAINALEEGKVDKTTTIAGVDLQDSITEAELRGAINEVTTSAKGLMSAADKVKLNDIDSLSNSEIDAACPF